MAVLRSLSRVEGLQYDGTRESAFGIVSRARGHLTIASSETGHKLLIGDVDSALRRPEVVEPGSWVVLTEQYEPLCGRAVYAEAVRPDDFDRLYYVTGDGPERLFA